MDLEEAEGIVNHVLYGILKRAYLRSDDRDYYEAQGFDWTQEPSFSLSESVKVYKLIHILEGMVPKEVDAEEDDEHHPTHSEMRDMLALLGVLDAGGMEGLVSLSNELGASDVLAVNCDNPTFVSTHRPQ